VIDSLSQWAGVSAACSSSEVCATTTADGRDTDQKPYGTPKRTHRKLCIARRFATVSLWHHQPSTCAGLESLEKSRLNIARFDILCNDFPRRYNVLATTSCGDCLLRPIHYDKSSRQALKIWASLQRTRFSLTLILPCSCNLRSVS
jgi:hypothetical protein